MPVTPMNSGWSSGKSPFARGEHMTAAPSRSASSRIGPAEARAPYPTHRATGPSVSNDAHFSTKESAGASWRGRDKTLGIGAVTLWVCTAVGIDRWHTKPPGRAKPLAIRRKICGNVSADSMTVAKWNNAPGAIKPSGIVSLSVSWIAHRPR